MAFVPNVPGVPPLPSFAVSAVALIFADQIAGLFGALNPWGIFRDGRRAFAAAQSLSALSFRKEYVIADYPIEAPGDGQSSGFMSYDKVELPFECRVRLISGGSEQQREALLFEVEQAAASLDLFDVVMPERFYENCNIQRYSFERTAENGVGVIKVDLTFQQIRSSETSAFTNTQQPGSSAQQGLGNVQPTRINGPGNITSFPLARVQ